MGQLERVSDDLAAMALDDKPLVLDTIAVAAMAGHAPPSKETGLILLSNDYSFYGLLFFFGKVLEAKEASTVKKVTELMRRIRVTFHLCFMAY